MQGGHANLDKNSFRGAIIGGTYENCFDDGVPVVSAPSEYDKRVVGVQFDHISGSHGSVSKVPALKLFLATAPTKSEMGIKTVDLGASWVCYKVSTGGFLVAASKILPHAKCICYFLPKHPSKWAAATNNLSPTHSSFEMVSSTVEVMDDSVVACGGFHDHDTEVLHSHEGECHQIIAAIEHFDADESKICHEDDEEDDHDHFQHTQVMYRNLCGGRTSTVPKLRFSSSDEEEEESIFSMHQDAQMTQETNGDVVFPGSCATDAIFDEALDESINALNLSDDVDVVRGSYDHFHGDTECIEDYVGPDWNNSVVVSNVMLFLGDMTSDLLLVSKQWALECFKIRAASLSQPGACQALDHRGWTRFMMEYGDGKFLSAGACKDVFCVYPQSSILPSLPFPSGAGFQAVSVMDMLDLQERGVADSIARELEISMLCSSLVTLNVCPNLLQIYSIFEADFPPCSRLWKRGNNLVFPSTQPQLLEGEVVAEMNKLNVGEFQYIRMEFCSRGDLEEVVRARESFVAEEVRSMFFQMCFALYTCREQLSMRHYDVKLLNFFSTGPESLFPSHDELEFDTDMMQLDETHTLGPCIDVGFGEHVYSLPLGSANAPLSQSIVKLADFGTSCVGSGTLSLPISAHQFTTLENTPPEYLFLGSHARECYSADTFCLGLSFFHLLAGEEPYEEHLKSVLCPVYLKGKLQKLWRTDKSESQYNVIAEVIDSLDGDDCTDVLYDTFYRYMVMFDLDISAITRDNDVEDSECDPSMESPYPPNNGVLCAAIDSLGLDEGRMTGPRSRLRRECIHKFQQDRAAWSLRRGTSDVMQRVRHNLSSLGEGSLDLLCMMVDLDASKRCSLHDALTSPLFHSLRVLDETCYPGSAEAKGGRAFMHYKNKQFLPIF